MRPKPLNEGRRWLRQAEEDLKDARMCAERGRYHLAAFLSQQAGEKALKGYLYAKGAEAVLGHSLSELSQESAKFDADFLRLKGQAANLDKYYLPTRYPNMLPGGIPAEAYDEEDANRALGLAEGVIKFVKDKLSEME